MSDVKISELLPEEIACNLNQAEKKLLIEIETKYEIDFSIEGQTIDVLSDEYIWDSSREIRSVLLKSLANIKDIEIRLPQRSIKIIGAKIIGALDFEGIILPFSLGFAHCSLRDGINLRGSEVVSMIFIRSVIGGIEGETLKCNRSFLITESIITGDIDLSNAEIKESLSISDKSVVNGQVRLYGAIIHKILSFRNSKFNNPNKWSIRADSAVIGSMCQMDGEFQSNGGVSFADAEIKSLLTCENGKFINPNGIAINADRIIVGKDAHLNMGFYAEGSVTFGSAEIGGSLVCENGSFINPNKFSISLYNAHIKRSVFLRKKSTVKGTVVLLAAKLNGQLSIRDSSIEMEHGVALEASGSIIDGGALIEGDTNIEGAIHFVGSKIGYLFSCCGASLNNPNNDSLLATKIYVNGNFLLKDSFISNGRVCLQGAQINGYLDCSNAKLSNNGSIALSADRMTTSGDALFENSKIDGDFSISGAVINGQLVCRGSKFNSESGYSFYADRITVKGDALFDGGFESVGEFRLRGATIENSLDFSESSFENNNGDALNLQNSEIKNALIWKKLNKKPIGVIDFSYAHVHQIADDEESWPHKNNLHLDGFEYDQIVSSSPLSLVKRIKWLNLQPSDKYFPKPYEQLAKIYRNIGHSKDSCEILIEKNIIRRKRTNPSIFGRWWDLFLQLSVGYGYKSYRVLIFSFLFICLSFLIFEGANKFDTMQPSKKQTSSKESLLSIINDVDDKAQMIYPSFSAMAYSIDSFVPFVNLHQEEYWLPSKKRYGGQVIWCWLWFHISVGWFFSTIFVVSLTGYFKNKN